MSASTTTQEPRYAPRPASAGPAPRSRPRDDRATGASLADAELEARFLNFLLPAVTSIATSILPKVAPQIGSAIGGLFGGQGAQIGAGIGSAVGGLFGGRDVAGPPIDALLAQEQLSRALDEQQMMQVVTTITQRATPALVAAVRQAGGDATDDETLERSWGLIASVLADEVIKHAPDAIKAVTKAFGSVLGSRDVDEFTPLLVDTEMTQRFVLPSLQTLIAATQQVLPQLFTLVSGARPMPRDTGISWSDLTNTKRLWDNDNIAVLGTTPIDNPDEIELVLELAPHKTWWKGIEVQDDNGSFITEIGVQDRTKVASVRVRAEQLLSPGGYLVFKKAKAFGVHTGMYRLATGGLSEIRGKRVHFFWYAD